MVVNRNEYKIIPTEHCLIVGSRNEAIRRRRTDTGLLRSFSTPYGSPGLSSPPVEDHAGNDEHGRHRKHLRKRFRGRPLGGLFHVYPPKNWA
jgi:hypothetical protein